jgi:hypothetical protein
VDNALKQGVDGFIVGALNMARALTSSGAMGLAMRQHVFKAELHSTLGDILSETPGTSATVGERCCAVRLQSGGRVLLVRNSGLRQLSRSELERDLNNGDALFSSELFSQLESGNELSEETHQAATDNAVEPASGVDGLSSVTDQDIEKNAGVMHDRRLMARTTGRAAALAVLFTQQHWEADAASVPRGYNEDGEEIDTARSAAIVEDEFTTLLEETEPQQQRQTELDSEPEPQSELELEPEPEREPVLDTAQTEHQRNFEQPKLDLRAAAHFDGSPPLLPPPHDSRRTVSTPREQCSLHSFQHVSTAAALCC